MTDSDPYRILFVCMGNICRSPAAEGVARAWLAERGLEGHLEVDSAGTIGYHAGAGADARMIQAASGRGYELTSIARQVTPEDLETFDLLVAMDRENLENLQTLERQASGDGRSTRARIRLLSSFLAEDAPEDVPDPYYGGGRGFDRVLDLLERGVPAVLEHGLERRGLLDEPGSSETDASDTAPGEADAGSRG